MSKKISPSLLWIRNWVWNYPHTFPEWGKSPRVPVSIEIFVIPNYTSYYCITHYTYIYNYYYNKHYTDIYNQIYITGNYIITLNSIKYMVRQIILKDERYLYSIHISYNDLQINSTQFLLNYGRFSQWGFEPLFS